MCDLRGYKNLGLRVQYACTILMMKFASRALYTVPRIHIQSEVYFDLKMMTEVSFLGELSL